MRCAPKVAEIMTTHNLSSLRLCCVYYLKTDPTTIACQMARGITQEKKEEGEELGMLTVLCQHIAQLL